jgi:hypothetical protein
VKGARGRRFACFFRAGSRTDPKGSVHLLPRRDQIAGSTLGAQAKQEAPNAEAHRRGQPTRRVTPYALPSWGTALDMASPEAPRRPRAAPCRALGMRMSALSAWSGLRGLELAR